MEKEKNSEIERYNFTDREKYWQNFWEMNSIYQFDSNSSLPVYSIDTPPPTISGSLHLGHIFSYTQAEVIARFKRMNGFNVRYPIGMDNNGLPTERLAEKEKGIKGSKLPLKDFIDICIDITNKYQQEYKNLWKSVGMSFDWKLEYSTISPEVQKLSQSVFKELYNKKLIYRKNAPALFCLECQTSFAQAEKEEKEKNAVFYDLLFKLETGKDLVIATTRPELLPACVAVFVNPSDKRYSDLVGEFVKTPLGDNVKILSDEKVDPEKGSGVVMCCTYGDETDVYWVKKYNLPEKIILKRDGTLKSTGSFNKYGGKDYAGDRKILIAELRANGSIVAEKQIVHNVGVHERCGTPVEFLPVTQWFVKIVDMKERLNMASNEINWYPQYMKKRLKEWVQGLKWDWCISRERFYGVPIPAYNCDTCEYSYVPSENEFPVDPKLNEQVRVCPECKKGNLVAERDVLDTWFTSALTPEINNQVDRNGKLKGKMTPMSMRPQAHDIIRTWALYSILMGLYRYDSVPWTDLMISGHILAKKGEKISKKTGGGAYKPEELIKIHSADAIRYAMSGVSLGKDAYFDEKEIEKGKKLVTKIYNAGKLVLGNIADYNPQNSSCNVEELEAIDKWIIDKSFEAGDEMSRWFNEYDFAKSRNTFENFFWKDFCDNYLEIVKGRLYGNYDPSGAKSTLSAKQACYIAFLNVLKMASPFIPHITEEMYHMYQGEVGDTDIKNIYKVHEKHGYYHDNEKLISIHKANWPHKTETLSNEKNNMGAELCLIVIAEVRKYKSNHRLKISQEIQHLIIDTESKNKSLLLPYVNDIKRTVKAIMLTFGQEVSGGGTEIVTVKV